MVRLQLVQLGFEVENGKTNEEKIVVPVLFGENGKVDKSYHADAYHRSSGYVVEVEAGAGVSNNRFLVDLFKALTMHGVDHLAIAVRIRYKTSNDFDRVVGFLDTLYTSNRFTLPLKEVLIIGY